MCRPAGVSDAAKTGQQCAVVYFFIQNAKPADCFFHMDFLTIKNSDPGRVIASVFQLGKPIQNDGGRLLFSEATVDALTGQVTLRGEFPNSAGDLLPGLYVRVAVEQAIRRDALSVPQMAVQRDAQGNAMVYVIGAENKVQARPVVLGTSVGATWIVESGLQAGDKVVVEGAQKMIPDAVVVPEPWQAPQAAAN